MRRGPGPWGLSSAPSTDSAGAAAWTLATGTALRPRGQVVLLAIGCLSLAAGALVYLIDRPAGYAQWLPAVASLPGRHLFGAIGQWLPSFVHPLAFSLFTAALLRQRPGPAYGACAFWLVVNVAFEMGQHPQVREPLVDRLRQLAGQGPVARAFHDYFLRGTFDGADLAASALGAMVAALVLHQLHRHRETRHVASPQSD